MTISEGVDPAIGPKYEVLRFCYIEENENKYEILRFGYFEENENMFQNQYETCCASLPSGAKVIDVTGST